MCISHHFPGGADTNGEGTPLWEPQVCGQAVGWRGENGLGGILEAGRGGSGNGVNDSAMQLIKMETEKTFCSVYDVGGEDFGHVGLDVFVGKI